MQAFLIGAICLLLFFVLLIGKKYKKGIWLERLSIFGFRFAMSIFILYIIHLVFSYYGTEITINFFSCFQFFFRHLATLNYYTL